MFIFIHLDTVVIVLSLTFNLGSYITENEDDFLNNVTMYSTDMCVRTTVQIQESRFQIPDEKWTTNALKRIAYYLRNYKFNEWDRRYYHDKPNDFIGYIGAFPTPRLRSIHWKVYENCYGNFYKCINYLYNVIEAIPASRTDDTILNRNLTFLNDLLIDKVDLNRKRSFLNTEKTDLPFNDPKEKFKWQTSASYFMCWYTMLGMPALSMIGESCDNFADCLDTNFGKKNYDPRANDRLPFACAKYSFCPDPCCPLKHVQNIVQCYEQEAINPCFYENAKGNSTEKQCKMNHNNNQNLKNIIANKWNVSCHCGMKGFKWSFQFRMCVDINECLTGNHDCDKFTEDCLNLPGTFECICKWGFSFDANIKKCVKAASFTVSKTNAKNHTYSIMDTVTTLLNYFGR